MHTTLTMKETWGECLKKIEPEVSKANFSTWFKNTSILKEDDGLVFVAVPNEFVKEWLSKKFHKLICKAVVELIPTSRGVEYTIAKMSDIQASQKEKIGQEPIKTEGLPFKDLYINKNDNLNTRYIFENFIVGPFNEIAYAAGQAILERPGTHYNPFFVYGSTGLGKTHLIQAIGNGLKAKHPEIQVYYTTLEKFSMDYINSVQSQGNKAHSFKEKYRKYDVVIMDDIQFIGKMEKTQEELFHLFNSLYENNKQIIFSSDKHPNYIPGLEERLLSRFSQGMIVDIIEPDYESRLAILQAKLQKLNMNLSRELLEYIASHIRGNIRELEGNLNTLLIQMQVKKRELNILEVKNLLKNSLKKKKIVSPREVVKVVSEFYKVSEDLIYEKTRRKEIVHARQMIMFILREEFNISYPMIGQELGGKDHTTIIHSYNKIKNELVSNSTLSQELEELKSMFK